MFNIGYLKKHRSSIKYNLRNKLSYYYMCQFFEVIKIRKTDKVI